MNNTGSSARQITVPRSIAWMVSLLLVVCLIFLGWAVLDYIHLATNLPEIHSLSARLSDYKDTIQSQRKHIQQLANDIDSVKSKLISLNQFEEKIRIIANIQKASDDEDSMFGVGGSFSEELETNIPLTSDHSSLLREMHEQVEQLDVASNNQETTFNSLITGLQEKQNLLASTPAIQPTQGWIASGFGYRTSPFTGHRVFHSAIDIANQEGTPIIATANGVVTFAGKEGLLGNLIVIDHGYGMVTRYGHLNKIIKKRGESVMRGDTIGFMGSTGRTTGPHLHYEVRLNGVPINPKNYILN
jgi:murein DD-endopeptidase MepM/ murein hydrolase activator NlpD